MAAYEKVEELAEKKVEQEAEEDEFEDEDEPYEIVKTEKAATAKKVKVTKPSKSSTNISLKEMVECYPHRRRRRPHAKRRSNTASV